MLCQSIESLKPVDLFRCLHLVSLDRHCTLVLFCNVVATECIFSLVPGSPGIAEKNWGASSNPEQGLALLMGSATDYSCMCFAMTSLYFT